MNRLIVLGIGLACVALSAAFYFLLIYSEEVSRQVLFFAAFILLLIIGVGLSLYSLYSEEEEY